MDRNGRSLAVGLLLAAACLAVFWPVVHHGFVNYDDPQYITENEHVRTGLTWANVVWAFGTGYASNWHPVTWISHMLDIQCFGLQPGRQHLINLLFHTANTLLLFLFLRRTTDALWRSAFVAALFAVHPLHVESVAWIAERKDVLSGFFFLLTLLAYARYAESRGQRTEGRERKSKVRSRKTEDGRRKLEETVPAPFSGAPSDSHTVHRPPSTVFRLPSTVLWYSLTLGLFTLGLMSKPMLVTLPFVLLLLDYWPLQRLSFPFLTTQRSTTSQPSTILIFEKLPFLALAGGSCILTFIAQGSGGAVNSIDQLPLDLRVTNAGVSYIAYLQQTFWPTCLAVFYPFRADYSNVEMLTAFGLLLVITAGVVIAARRRPYALVGWLWYLGMLVPVIGLAQVGTQARADRYTYLPLIGVFIVISWGLGSMRFAQNRLKPRVAIAAFGCLIALGLVTQRQVRHWRSTQALFEHAAQVTKNNYIAVASLGTEEVHRGNYAAANALLARALEYSTNYGPVGTIKYHYGVALQLEGKGLEALPYLEQSEVPTHFLPERNYRLGLSLLEAGRLPEAEAALNEAIKDEPQSPEYQLGRAALLYQQGHPSEAEELFRAVLTKHPDSEQAHRTFGDFLVAANRQGEAETEYARMVELNPTNAVLRRTYAATLGRLGKTNEAIQQLRQVLKQEPTNALAHFELAELAQGTESIRHYALALEAEPKLFTALNNLAWLLATSPDSSLRNGPRAVELAERACQLTEWKSPPLMGTLAAAYAEAGRFQDAIATAEKARDQARAAQEEFVAKRNEDLLRLYRSGKPVRE